MIIGDFWILTLSVITILGYSLYTVDPMTVENVGSRNFLYTVPFVIDAMLWFQPGVYFRGRGEYPT